MSARTLRLPPLVDVDIPTRAKVLKLAERITEATGVDAPTMLSRDRSPDASNARQHLMVALWRDEGLSVAEVAAVLGRDHTTVMYGLRRLVPREAYVTEMRARMAARGRLGSYRGPRA